MTRLIVLAVLLTGLAACETAKGVGRDINKAGTTISDTAEDVQESL